ncbi:cilia- and flagella-associated protein 65 [Aulostomus maculatus]
MATQANLCFQGNGVDDELLTPHLRDQRRHHLHMSRQKKCFLGLETRQKLVWEDWDMGKEFTKTLVLKNVDSKSQKLHLSPPQSEFFTTVVPQIILLSPGTSYSLPITFRPLQRCEYEDSVEFHSKDGSFKVFLHAVIPCPVLEVPDSVLLPLCAVQHSSQTTFQLKNTGFLQTYFQWECPAPFQMSPEQGLLKPLQECDITVIFTPHQVLVHQQLACCMFGKEKEKTDRCCTVLLQGLAKYPCLQLRHSNTKNDQELSDPELQFGSVATGQSTQKYFYIFNPSPVTASFSLSCLSGGVPLLGSEFICDITSGKVAPGGSLKVHVTYTPAVANTVSVEYLSLKCSGALNKPVLKFTGNSLGPKVSLSSSLVDFGCVKEEGEVAQTVELVNSSSVEAVYQWDLDCRGHSVFSIHPAGGTVRPQSRLTLKVAYRPTQPIAHHRRVACFILYEEPLFLDLIGTHHSYLQQPAILKPEHLAVNKLHWHSREDLPDNLSTMQQEEGSLEELSNKGPESAPAVLSTPMEEYLQFCLGNLDPESSVSPHVSVVPSELFFNHKMSSSGFPASTLSQGVSVTNHTREKLSLVWTIAQDSSFSIAPASHDLAPLKSTSFRVTYDPKQLNTLHGAQLECFAYCQERPPLPPWCVTVRVIGHSFQLGKNYIPRCSLKPKQVVFPSLSVLSYRTVLLHNSDDLPLTFCLSPHRSSDPALAASVFVVPSCGLIQPGDHQILTLRTTSTEDCPKEGFSLHLQLNAAKHTQELTVVSVLEKCCVSLEGGGRLYFQPTHVGSQSQRTHHIRNLCSVPLRFQWNIPESGQELLSIEPDAGELTSNESSFQTWSFSPLEEKTYTLEPTLTFWPTQFPGYKSLLTLNVVGMGSKGFIEAERAVVDVGDTLVGSYRSFDVPLVNNSSCPISFSLSVQQNLLDDQLIHDPHTEPTLQLDFERGVIAAHSTMLLQSTFRPHKLALYQWTISYQTLNTSGGVLSPPQAVCEVRAKGVFPTLKVTDACGDGSARQLSKAYLWKLFSLDSLNKHLLSSPCPALSDRTQQRLRSRPTIGTKAMLDFDFGAAPLNSEPSTFVLMFHNPVCMAVDWTFVTPEDQQIELEDWAETGEFTNTELLQIKAQSNHLFTISPRSGTLLSGQQRAVHFSFRSEMILNLQGLTVERDQPCLHFPSKHHVFASVFIGDLYPPVQMCEVYNGGAVPVHYEVDSAVLSQLREENFNHPVLSCLNPEGEILPGRMAVLEFIFSPLEAKTYIMDVPVHIRDGNSPVVRFEGCGLDSPTVGSSNPLPGDAKPSLPCVQQVVFPGQVVFLSEDTVSLGDIPVCSQSSRVIFLTNMSCRDTYLYSWDLVEQMVQIHPDQGTVRPGESTHCVLTFSATNYPTVYQLDITCQFIQEAALALYHDALQYWEEETERRRDEFIITDVSKEKTPPPMCATKAERRAQRELAKVLTRPEPPQPGLLHLVVTARSYETLTYFTHFPDQFSKYHE